MGQIKVQKNVGGIEGLCIIEPTVHGDNRGYFMETYNSKDMQEAGIDRVFVQDNQSCSTKECSVTPFPEGIPTGKACACSKGLSI